MAYTKRDSKDPMPTAKNTARVGEGGNTPYPAGAEKHDSSKAEKISASSNRTTGATAMAVPQPTRQNGDGNTTVTGETHNSAKAEKISADKRF